jgi:PHD/YefM family antitoxin component YafN of YafNO toxin-antitoxin module
MLIAKVSEYRSHLSKFHQEIIKHHDPLRIAGGREDMIVLSSKDYDNLIETLHILKDKVTMESLLETRKKMADNSFKGKKIEAVFDDLMGA